MKKSTMIITIWVVGIGVMLSGCAAALLAGGAAAAGAGTVMYINGELKVLEEVSLEKAWEAAQTAAKSMRLFTTDKQRDALTAKLTVMGTDEKKVQIALKSQAGGLTEIRIRVGIMGDRNLSERILEEMEQNF